MIEMVTERYDDYLGGLFTTSALAEKVDLVNGEGARGCARTTTNTTSSR